MDFRMHYTKQQEDFRKEVQAWIKANVPENMKAPRGEDYEPTPEQETFWKKRHMELAELGWLHPTYPKKYGGGGLTADHETILLEEFQRNRVTQHHADVETISTLLVWGTEAQKQKFLVPLMKGERTSHQKLTEPQSGADQANIKTRAVKDGDDWLISGENVFISTFKNVNWLTGQAMTDPNAPRHRNTGLFIIENPAPGLLVKEMDLLVGHRQKQIYMDNVRVSGDHLIGGPTQGWQVMGTLLEAEHGGRGRATPTDEQADNLLDYVKKTQRDGQTVGSNPVLADKAVDALLESKIATLLVVRTYSMYQSHQAMQYESNLANVFGRYSSLRNAIRYREVMGLSCLVKGSDPRAIYEGTPEVFQRGAAGQRHAGGSSNIAKVILARRMGISRTKERAAPTPSTATKDGV